MKRAVLTLSGTVAGLAALFSFKSHVPGIAEASAASTPAGLSPTAPAVSSSASASPTLKSPAATPSGTKAAKAKPKAPASAAPTAAKPVPTASTPAATAPTTSGGGTAPTSAPASSTPTKAPSAPASSAPATPTASASPTAASGTFTGSTENTQYGPVEVQITVSGGKITNAADLDSPADSIGANAVSQLDSEVVSAQSANVQAVSGATYTSDGYIASLQSAVDQAGL